MSSNDGSMKNRDWSTSRAARVDNGAIGSGWKKETHVRSDGTYVVLKNQEGTVISVTKIS